MQKQRLVTARRSGAEAAISLRKWRAWYDGEGGDGQGGNANTGNDPAKNGSGDNPEVTFTPTQQAAIDKLLSERLKRDRDARDTKQREALLKELGIEDPDADKELLAAARKRKLDEMGEVEKATKAATDAATKLVAKEAELEAERAERRLERRDSRIKAALRDASVKNADKTFAVLAALKKADVEAVLKDDGTVDEKSLTALIDAAKKDYGEDFGPVVPARGSPSLQGGRTPTDAERTNKALGTKSTVRL